MPLRLELVALGLLALLAPATPALAQLPCAPCTIGVALDGPWERNDEVRAIFEREIAAVAAPDFDVVFPDGKRLLADWTLESARNVVERLLSDPEVDVVLTSGPLVSTYVSRRPGALEKPVIAPFVLNPDALGIPIETNDADELVSGVPNLGYVTFPNRLDEELRRFREVAPFSRLAMLVNDGIFAAVPEIEANVREEVAELDLAVTIVRVGSSVDEALAAIPPDADAVYVVPLIQLPPGDFDRLVAGLIDRRLPSFSFWGRADVERGLLTSIYLDADFDRLGRRLALDVVRVLRGEDAGAMPVDFRRSTRLTLNMATARAIGEYPSWSVLTEAELLADARLDGARQIDLATAARTAVDVNLDVLAAARLVAEGREEVSVARAVRRPQISASAGAQFIDRDRAEAGFGGQPQRLFRGTLGASQLLFSDAANAGVEIQTELLGSREQVQEQTRLDVALDAAVTYLNVLRAKTLEQIQRNNLTVTRSNLELAQIRQQIGVARAAEVVRWENQIASNRQAVIDASAQRNLAEIALNRLLDRPLEEPFETREATLDDPALLTAAVDLEPFVGNPAAFDVFRDFMTQEGLSLSPELRQLDAGIRAREREVLAARRALRLPTVSLDANATGLETGGAGSSFDLGAQLPFTLEQPNRLNWTVGLNAVLPLFAGGGIRAEERRAREALLQLGLERDAASDRIEQRLRSALHEAGASYAGIELAAAAADAARRNLELVTDAYEEGVVQILDLLDAQNAALASDLAASSAVYDYLIDLMRVQRAVGRFDFFMSDAEHRAFLERLREFFAASDYRPRAIQ